MLRRTGRRKTKRPPANETFILLKPDGMKRQLLAMLLLRLYTYKLCVVALKTVRLSPRCVAVLYEQHCYRKSYTPMKKWLMSGTCVAIHVTGRRAVSRVREMMGTGTFPYPKLTFRGTYATTQWRNTMHASDNPETAAKEIGYFFSE